jgi:hypothetical protein
MNKLETRGNELYIVDPILDNGEVKVLKGWESWTGWFWFATEITKSGECFGLVQGFEEEWGYFTLQELESLPGKVWEIKPQDLPHAGRRHE